MPTGNVKWWNDSKGYGFLTPDDGSEDVFVHFRVLEMEGFRTLREGQRVEFSIRQGAKGLHADNVRPLDDDIPPLHKGSPGTCQPVQPNRPKLKVFLCHSSGDKNAVRQLFDRLSAIPYVSPWLDEKNLLPGQDFKLEIARAVKEAECVVVCLSHSSINKEGYFQKEISFALDVAQEKPEGTIYLIPVRLEACQPPTRLERWHYVDLFVEGGFERLLLSLQYRATRLGLLLSPVTIKGNMQTAFDNELLTYFTDVEHLRGVFKEYVTAKTLPKRLLVIHGVGGVGKSSLLRMFRLHCKGAHIPVSLASGDEAKSALDVLARWMDALKADGVAFPAFGKTFEHYRTIQAKVDEEAKKEGALGGMGGEALVDWLRGFLNQPDIDLLLDPTRKFIDDFLGDVALAADKQRMVLMLDTFEQMATLDHWARDVAQRLHTNTLFVIGGRALPNWSRAWQSWIAHAQVEELKPMTEDDMRELVRRYYATMRGGEPNPAQVEAIVRFARGLPIVVTSVVRLWVKYPDRVGDLKAVTPEVMADLVDLLIEGVPKEFIPTLEAAAVVRWFDQPILRAVTALADVRDVYNELRRFPFVRTRAEGLALHDAVREIMDENLRVQDSERHCGLHERAAAYFEKRLEKTTGEEAERLGLERLYHRVRAGEEAGIRLFQEMAEELVRYRLVNRSHALLNDVNTYPLERENSRLWREYYNARLAHLVELIDEAEEKFQAIIENQYVDPKLKAYALCDYGAIARRIERQSLEKAVHILEQIPALGVAVDSKLVFYLLELSGAYRRQGRRDDSLSCLTKARDYFARTGDYYGLAYAYNRTKYHYLNQGIWKEGFEMQRLGLEALSKVSEQSFLRAEFLSGLSVGWVWAGLFREAEGNLKEAAAISDKLNTTSLYSFRDLGLVLGLRGKLSEATNYFERSISIAQSHNDFVSIAFAKGFQGFVALKWAELAVAEHYLGESIAAFRKWPDKSEMPLLLNWWGMLNEAKRNYQCAQSGFEECIGLKKIGRIYWHAGALTGLVRVKHAQGDYAAIAPLLAEAEQLAQQYEYNDHLASLRLTQAMLAWEGITHKSEI